MSDLGDLEPDTVISDDWKREAVEVALVFTVVYTALAYVDYLSPFAAVMFIPLSILLYFSVDLYRYQREVDR